MKLNDETKLKKMLWGKTVFPNSFFTHSSQFFIKYFICLTVINYCYYYPKMPKTNNYFHLQIP